jgi:hypothetical protein
LVVSPELEGSHHFGRWLHVAVLEPTIPAKRTETCRTRIDTHTDATQLGRTVPTLPPPLVACFAHHRIDALAAFLRQPMSAFA